MATNKTIIPTLHIYPLTTLGNLRQMAITVTQSSERFAVLRESERAEFSSVQSPSIEELNLFRVRARLVVERPELAKYLGCPATTLQQALHLDEGFLRMEAAGYRLSGSTQAATYMLGATAAERTRVIGEAVVRLQGENPNEAAAIGAAFAVPELLEEEQLERGKATNKRQDRTLQSLEAQLEEAAERLEQQTLLQRLMHTNLTLSNH